MIIIKIDNPEIEAKYSKEEIEKKVSIFLSSSRKKRDTIKLYSKGISEFSSKVQDDLNRSDEKLEYIDY